MPLVVYTSGWLLVRMSIVCRLSSIYRCRRSSVVGETSTADDDDNYNEGGDGVALAIRLVRSRSCDADRLLLMPFVDDDDDDDDDDTADGAPADAVTGCGVVV